MPIAFRSLPRLVNISTMYHRRSTLPCLSSESVSFFSSPTNKIAPSPSEHQRCCCRSDPCYVPGNTASVGVYFRMVQSQDAYVDSGFRKSPVEKERGGGLYAVFALFVIVFFQFSFRIESPQMDQKKTASSRFLFCSLFSPFSRAPNRFLLQQLANQPVLLDTIVLILLSIYHQHNYHYLPYTYLSSKAPLLFYYHFRFITFALASVLRLLLALLWFLFRFFTLFHTVIAFILQCWACAAYFTFC